MHVHFDMPKQKSSIIKVLGVGGGGSNAVNYMFAQDIEGVDFVICNTDAKALEQSRVPNKIQLGPHLTQGLGAGANPEVGKQATEESLEEIRKILEVNTKMAFITAGMGGGTGTGGAPIMAKICRDLGILTVGIVTTPFVFEGPRRSKQAEEGIRQLQPYVDTLLVISNDKLRMQYGNLKMTEAFGKADNVLATAAKCITDIINSKGTIIVDFADVCTVMKNGGVAILGSATAEGEDRAERAIEQALNSPLLNDSEIRGAKWILLNINSSDGQNECTMDEFEIINNYVRSQSGDNTDLIIGTGYDNTLGDKIGITLIATGFEYKDPFNKKQPVAKKKPVIEEKIVMTLGIVGEEKKLFDQKPIPSVEKDLFAPKMIEESETIIQTSPVVLNSEPEESIPAIPDKEEEPVHFKLAQEDTATQLLTAQRPGKETPAHKIAEPVMQSQKKEDNAARKVAGGFLNRPKNIYANTLSTEQEEVQQPVVPVQTTEQPKIFLKEEPKPEDDTDFKLVIKEEEKKEPVFTSNAVIDDYKNNQEEEQKRRAAERINKLRNLSFNMNSADVNNEYDNVPAYVRRNMDLFGSTLTSVEQFYSKITVKKDENNETQISTINTFLDGKKPD